MSEKKKKKEITGIFRGNIKGFGFLTPDEEFIKEYPEDLFIGKDNTAGAMSGDHIRVRIIPSKRDRYGRSAEKEKNPEAEVIEILTRAVIRMIGTIEKEIMYSPNEPSRYFVIPDNGKLATYLEIPQDSLCNAKEGDKVEAEITEYPTSEWPFPLGSVTRVFGNGNTKKANYEAILCENGIRTEFPQEVLLAAKAQSEREIIPEKRADYRNKIIFTIDGEDSKDFDDAISLEYDGETYLLGVHIADVTAYVKEGSPIDNEAYARGTSLYFADRVIPMLPEALSNGICSLNPNEDRYALSAMIRIDKYGEIKDCTISESIICSKLRGVYSELNDIIEKDRGSAYYEKYQILFPEVYPEMLHLYRILEEKNRKKGALGLETAEAKIILDDTGFPSAIERREQGISEKLIENFMLCANEAVARWLYQRGIPCVFRVHEEPPEDKIQTLAVFAYNLGIDVRPLRRKDLTPGDMQEVLDTAKERGLGSILSTVLLRSLSKARYSPVQGIHFGLAAEFYCHFTSPIRRYPDLTVHRFVKNSLHCQDDEEQIRHMKELAEKAAEQSNNCELRSLNAERAIEELYKTLFMQEHIGEVFDGVISSVTSFGFFVELGNTCEGLVSVSSLPGRFTFDEKNLVLSSGRQQYRLGQRVRVEAARADVTTRKLDFLLVTDPHRETAEKSERRRHAEARPSGHRRR